VIGLACRYPGAATLREFWENVIARRCQFRRIPEVRLPLSEYYSEDRAVADKTYGSQAAVIDGFEFNWIGRGIPKPVFESSDIVHWLALDVALGAHPGAPRVDTLPLGKGPSIGVGPNFHPKLVARLKKVAQAHEIPYRIEPTPGRSGTDAWAIQITREGVPTALLSLPLRYMHQPVETLDVQDVERAGRLLAAFIAGLETDFLEKLAWDSPAESE
jgi:hypothetical protein